MAIKTLRSARAFKNGKDKLLELVLELRLFHDHTEQGSNCRRKESIRPATKTAEYKHVIAMLYAHAEDGANLVEHDFPAFGCEATIFGLIRKLVDTCVVGLAVEAERSYGDNVALEGLISKGVILGDVVSEEGNAMRENATVIDVVRISDFS